MLFLQAHGMLSLVADLYQVAQVCKQAKEAGGSETVNLQGSFKHALDLLLSRLEACQATEDSAREAQEMMILDEHHNIPYLEWKSKAKALQIKKDKEALPMSEALRILKGLQQRLVLIPLVVMRFHSTRKLVKEHKGEILPMMFQIDYRISNPRGTADVEPPEPPHTQRSLPHLRRWAGAHWKSPPAVWEWLRRQTRSVTPWNHLAWRAAHTGLRQPSIQHDVGEYSSFLRARMHCNAVGLRESRMKLSDQPARRVDRGTIWPVFFQEPVEGRARPSKTAVSMQSLLDAWAQQEGEHALVKVPAVLCLINRFNIGSADSHKSVQPVVPELQIPMPKFCHDVQIGDALQYGYVLYAARP
ncbi:unnamed protein product [Symbiodinium sp. CCMP2592]|nr:unnamed protein product [Symbiodinium sp. CCMP2592]